MCNKTNVNSRCSRRVKGCTGMTTRPLVVSLFPGASISQSPESDHFYVQKKEKERNLRENKILSFKKLLFLMYLFLFGYVGFSLLHGVSSNCGEWRLVSRCVQVSHCSGFSCLRSRALGFVGFSSCGSWALEQGSIVVTVGLSCSMACGIFLDQMEPMSPALAGGLFTTEPPREPRIKHYLAENT